MVYLTAVVLEDGMVHFFDDIYGHDKALQQALAKVIRIRSEGLKAVYQWRTGPTSTWTKLESR